MPTLQRTSPALALACAMTFAAAAQGPSADSAGDELSTSDLDPVIVTATRRASEALTTPATITIIDQAQLKAQQVTDFRELFRYQPGISVGHGSRERSLETSIEVRGIGGQRLALVVDGVRLPGGYTAAGATLGQLKLDPAGLRRVEVLRGPASSLYGSDALAGVIVFRTLSPTDFLGDGQRLADNAAMRHWAMPVPPTAVRPAPTLPFAAGTRSTSSPPPCAGGMSLSTTIPASNWTRRTCADRTSC